MIGHSFGWYTWAVSGGHDRYAIGHTVVLVLLGGLLYKHGEGAAVRRMLDAARERGRKSGTL